MMRRSVSFSFFRSVPVTVACGQPPSELDRLQTFSCQVPGGMVPEADVEGPERIDDLCGSNTGSRPDRSKSNVPVLIL